MSALGSIARRYLDARAPHLGEPTVEERRLVAQLREEIGRSPEPSGDDPWSVWERELRRQVLDPDGDPRRFLRWDVVSLTMFVGSPLWAYRSLRVLRALPDWESRWRPALREVETGSPRPLIGRPWTSGQLVLLAFHIARLERLSGLDVREMSTIVELGGGYGSMARMLRAVGFAGRHVIYDLPSVISLQRFYLGLLEAQTGERVDVELTSDADDIDRAVASDERSLFIALWSLSETPMTVRDDVLPRVHGAHAHWIGYQPSLGGVDNVAWVRRWRAENPAMRWVDEPFEFKQGERYLAGVRTSRSSPTR